MQYYKKTAKLLINYSFIVWDEYNNIMGGVTILFSGDVKFF